MSETKIYQGSCACGKVQFQFQKPEREVVACHCKQCRQLSGHFVAATAVKLENFSYHKQENLQWYASSDFAKRGFCNHCGSQLFYQMNDADKISIMAGSIEDTGDMKIEAHIYCAEKGDYYDIDDDAPHYQQSDKA